MSTSSEFSEFSGNVRANMSEKASFSQTCSLLSQYFKEKASFGDLGLGSGCNKEGKGAAATTMNLFPVIDRSGNDLGNSARNMATPRNLSKSMDLFPQQAGFGPPVPKENFPKTINSSASKSASTEPEAAQMTIFYGGQVIVFNNFPADKAKEVMLLASKGSSQSQSHTNYAANLTKTHSAFAPNSVKNPADSATLIAPSSTNVVPNFSNNLIQEHMQPSTRPIACDLPIARKASLHRFLEKRKDRINAMAPYQTNNPAAAPPPPPPKPVESKSWLGLAAQSPQ